MDTWWETLPTFEKILWGIAVLFSVMFLVQTLISFIGGDSNLASGDPDDAISHDDGTGSSFFTIKNFIAFFTMFGWVALAARHGGSGEGLSALFGAIAGALLVAIMMWLMNKAGELRHSGTLDLRNAIGATGNTYLIVPAARGGVGKVSVRVQGGLRELDAMTDDAGPIPTGSIVRVADTIDGRILLVTSKL